MTSPYRPTAREVSKVFLLPQPRRLSDSQHIMSVQNSNPSALEMVSGHFGCYSAAQYDLR